ncbi:hypothetical protein GCM10027188_29010 [Lysobacter humi (ex Lee et al. 2017)]
MRMKYLAAFAVALIASCATVPTGYSSLDSLLANPGASNGRPVAVCGWFFVDTETCTLAPVKGTAGSQDESTTIWVVPKSDVCLPKNWQMEPHGRWAVVEGTFHTGKRFGHLGLFRHGLSGATVTRVRNGCQPGSAPNNSSKPTPLRGAA